jgi:hypothetical protein
MRRVLALSIFLFVFAIATKIAAQSVSGTATLRVVPSGALFQDGFESGNFAAWDAAISVPNVCTPPSGCGHISINNNSTFVHGGGFSEKITFNITGSQLESDSWAELMFDKRNINALHLFYRTWVYYHNIGTQTNSDWQRKLFYIKAIANGAQTYAAVILLENQNYGNSPGELRFDEPIGDGGALRCDSQTYLNFEQWYEVEIEVKFSDPGVANGFSNVWLNGTKLALSDKNHSTPIQGGCGNLVNRAAGLTNLPTELDVGTQMNRQNPPDTLPGNEERYLDDVVVSNTFIP